MLRLLISSGLVAALGIAAVAAGVFPTRQARAVFTPPADANYVALDCDLIAPGIQDACAVGVGDGIDVAVVVGNAIGVAGGADFVEGPQAIVAYNFNVVTDQTKLTPNNGADANLNANPDLDQASLGGTSWDCANPPPSKDQDPSAAVASSFLACLNSALDSNPVADDSTIRVAVVHYTAAALGAALLTLSDVGIGAQASGSVLPLADCNPDLGTGAVCFGATITVATPATNTPTATPTPDCSQPTSPPAAGCPTWTATPTSTCVWPMSPPDPGCVTPTATPTPCDGDQDCDGVLDAADNCVSIANPAQTNSDGNFIDQTPPSSQDDRTWPRSDGDGDVCDADDDNDGVFDVNEGAGCNTSGPLSPTNRDTDGDRVLDGAECALGTNPASAASKPTAAACAAMLGVGASVDTDGDRLFDRIEYCAYNTDRLLLDSDGDQDGFPLNANPAVNLIRDGCEAASLDGNRVVNSGDQLLIALEIAREVDQTLRLVSMDINKDGGVNSGDQLLMVGFIVNAGSCP